MERAEGLSMNIRDLMPEREREHALATVRQQCETGVLEPQRQQRIAKMGELYRCQSWLLRW